MDHYEQDIEKGKFEIGAAEFSVDAGSPLPEGYGDNRLVIMARDPLWFFAYWELTHEKAEQVRQVHGRDIWDRAVLIMRVYDVTDAPNNSTDDATYFDIELTKQARSWYVQVARSGRAYIADLGLRLPDGRFITLLRSNRILMPVGRVSDLIDAQWMSVGVSEFEEWEKFIKVSQGLGSIGKASAEFSRGMAQRWEFLRSVFSGSVSSWPSSKLWASSMTFLQGSEKKS